MAPKVVSDTLTSPLLGALRGPQSIATITKRYHGNKQEAISKLKYGPYGVNNSCITCLDKMAPVGSTVLLPDTLSLMCP